MPRQDGRLPDQLRPLAFVPNFQSHPLGSVLAACGGTRVVCAVSLEDKVPSWMKVQGVPGGWITAEYQMIPSATGTRGEREAVKGRLSGRTSEIQRLVGRALRAVVDLRKLPPVTLHVDCDVIDAALEIALRRLERRGLITEWPMKSRVAAVSVGILDGEVLADLCYVEDSAADVDMNIVMTDSMRFVEIQGTGEEATFGDEELSKLLSFGRNSMKALFAEQERVVRAALDE